MLLYVMSCLKNLILEAYVNLNRYNITSSAKIYIKVKTLR